MCKFTLQDGTTLHIAAGSTVITNCGPMLASAVTPGVYIRCGKLFCRVDAVEVI